MKNLVSTIVCLLFYVLSFAQDKEVMYVSVIGEQISEHNKHIIEDVFHVLLKDQYEIRLDQGQGLFSNELYNELKYQELGAVAKNAIKEFGLQSGADYLCVVIVESSKYKGEYQYYFRSKIYDVETAILKESASYPQIGFDDKPLMQTQINDVTELQHVSAELIIRLGIKAEDNIIKDVSKDKWILTPDKKGYDIRLVCAFSVYGRLGLGFHLNRSYFQIGFDFMSSFDSGGEYYKEDLAFIDKNEISSESGKIIYENYAMPYFQFSISPGLNFKYFAIDCGLGFVLCDNIEYKYKIFNDEYYNYNSYTGYTDYTTTNTCYFVVQPSIVGYIPFSNNGIGLSMLLGYNVIPSVSSLNGVVFGLGITW